MTVPCHRHFLGAHPSYSTVLASFVSPEKSAGSANVVPLNVSTYLSFLPGCGSCFLCPWCLCSVTAVCTDVNFSASCLGFAGFTESKECCVHRPWKILSPAISPAPAPHRSVLLSWNSVWMTGCVLNLLGLSPMPSSLISTFFLRLLCILDIVFIFIFQLTNFLLR